MIIEYAGIADRWAGPGVVHEVRAWWNINHDTEGKVKRAALDALNPSNGVYVLGTAEVIGMDTSTYNTPQMNAMVRIRVMTPEEVRTRTELRGRKYTRCDGCGCDHPGQLVRDLTAEDVHVARVGQDACGPECDGREVHSVRFGRQPVGVERALCFGCWHPIRDTCKVLHWIKADGTLQI